MTHHRPRRHGRRRRVHQRGASSETCRRFPGAQRTPTRKHQRGSTGACAAGAGGEAARRGRAAVHATRNDRRHAAVGRAPSAAPTRADGRGCIGDGSVSRRKRASEHDRTKSRSWRRIARADKKKRARSRRKADKRGNSGGSHENRRMGRRNGRLAWQQSAAAQPRSARAQPWEKIFHAVLPAITSPRRSRQHLVSLDLMLLRAAAHHKAMRGTPRLTI